MILDFLERIFRINTKESPWVENAIRFKISGIIISEIIKKGCKKRTKSYESYKKVKTFFPHHASLFPFTSLPFLILLSYFIFLVRVRRCSNLSCFCSGWICMAPRVGPVLHPCSPMCSPEHVCIMRRWVFVWSGQNVCDH